MRSNGNLDIVVLLRHWTKGGIKNFVTEDASVIKERVVQGGQVLPKRRSTECVQLSLAAPENLCGESVENWRYWRPQWGKFYGKNCSCTHTNCTWYKNSSLMIYSSGWRVVRTCWAGWKRIRVCPNGSFLVMKQLFFIRKGQQAQHPDMGIPESSCSNRDGTWVPKWMCFVPFTEDACSAHFLHRRQCYWKGVPGHVGKLVNATTCGWGGPGLH